MTSRREGGPRAAAHLALAGLAALVGLATVLALGYAVYLDATARSADSARELGVLAAVAALPVVPVYVLLRGRLGDREPPAPRERRVRTVALAVLLAFTAGALVPIPDSVTQVTAVLAVYVPALVAAYLLVGR